MYGCCVCVMVCVFVTAWVIDVACVRAKYIHNTCYCVCVCALGDASYVRASVLGIRPHFGRPHLLRNTSTPLNPVCAQAG
jgi:hypothetical protein